LAFAVMGERRGNRTHAEYMDIKRRMLPLKELTYQINRLLQQAHRCNDECGGYLLPEICRFAAGHDPKRIRYEAYPKSISSVTVRASLEIAGMRDPRWKKH
jgi:hypothetical protein